MLTLKKPRRRSKQLKREVAPTAPAAEPAASSAAPNQDEESGFEPHRDAVRWDSGKQVGNKI